MSRIKADLSKLCEIASEHGATNAKAIDVDKVVVDERNLLKCMIPRCMYYGQNYTCPPYTLTPKEFREIISKYRHAIVVQVEAAYPKKLSKIVYESQRLSEVQHKLKDILGPIYPIWKKLHTIVETVEKEAFNLGYYYSFGLVCGTCKLCKKCNVPSPCRHPFKARPSMEAVGIDVLSTLKNIGLEIKVPAREIILNGLIFIGPISE